jgi:hypothetical protein
MSRYGSRTRVGQAVSDFGQLPAAVVVVAFDVNFLVVAGGGGAGGQQYASVGAGGGGAGGFRCSVDKTGMGLAAEDGIDITLSTNYTVTVGAGGAGGAALSYAAGVSGSDSVFSTITSLGGGNGISGPPNFRVPLDGGCGGAGGFQQTRHGNGTLGQGFSAGACQASVAGASGGGGAGAYGVFALTTAGGAGGAGLATTITGSSVFYAGGGGGGGQGTAPAGGNGGGGNGGSHTSSVTAASNGTANTGGGGGGGAGANAGANGGSGVVILRYLSTLGTITIGAGLTGSTATDGLYEVTTITAGTGNVSWA